MMLSIPGIRPSRLPIAAMTANAFEEDRQRVLYAGMNGHLGKLFAAVQDILGGERTC